MADETSGLLEQAATATQGMIPGLQQQQQQMTAQGMTGFGPTPLVQPPPLPKFQPPQDQSGRQTHFETVGSRKRADKQALFHGIAGMVKAGNDYLQAKKQRGLSMDIQRLMEAQQGMEEAKQALQQNPNDPAAKEALERNTGIVNDITSDPKKSKLLQKAFNIDLFGDGKNKKENAALVDAFKEFNKKKQAGDKTALNPIAQKIMGQQPQREQLSPEAAQQAKMIQLGLAPKAGEILKAQAENFKTLQSAKNNEERNVAIDRAAKTRADAVQYHADKVFDAMNIKVGGMKYAADVKARSEMYRANKVADSWTQRTEMLGKIAGIKSLNDQTKMLLGSISTEAKTFTTQLKNLSEDNVKLFNILDKKGTTIIGGIKLDANKPSDEKIIRQKIGQNNAAMRDVQSNLNDRDKQLQNLQQMGIISMAQERPDSSDADNSDDNSGSVDVEDTEVPE